MKKNHLKQAEALLGHFKPVDLDCAYTIAYALGHQDTYILLTHPVTTRTTVRQIYAGTAYGCPADKIRIRFYGGPVGHGQWYDGTVYSFILDCISAKIQMEGFERTRALLRVRRQSGCPPF